MRVRWTPAAVNDLKAISNYIERDRNLDAANRVCRAIYNTVQTLRHHPESGKVGNDQGTRELVIPAFPNYIVVCRPIGLEAVEILRIWHGAQDRED